VKFLDTLGVNCVNVVIGSCPRLALWEPVA